MRICLYTETALPKMGGQEMVVDALARQFQVLGHDPVVLAPRPRLPLRAQDSQLPYLVVRHPRFYSTRFLVGWYRWFLRRLHRRCRFDVLHCHGLYPPAYLAALSRASVDIPTVVTSHGGDVNPQNVRLAKPVLRERHVEGLRCADALVAISRYTRAGFQRLCPEAKTVVDIPNGVDLEAFANPVPRPVDLDAAVRPGEYLLFLGRLQYRKGVDVLLQALARVPGATAVQLVVAGAGDIRGDLEALCRKLGLGERVRFVGQVTGQKKLYLLQNTRATVIPSRGWEAFPLVTLESYAAGKPVIAADLPGLAENVLPDRTGFVVPPEAPDILAQRLRQALAEPEMMQQMGRTARQFVCDFSWPAVALRHLDLYERLRAARRRKAS
jgi:glycosyltransferase involved in cell wall biosynthesis